MADPPSREANPFATCWTRPGALPYESVSDSGVEPVLARLKAANWRGQIVGPHGAGKSTLMHALRERLGREGVGAIDWHPSAPEEPGRLLLAEGFEKLPPKQCRTHLRAWRRSGQRFLLTTHRPLRWQRGAPPVVATLAPDCRLLARLFQRLTAERRTPVTLANARASFALRRGDLREVWFDLYDLHEKHARANRTVPVAASYELAETPGPRRPVRPRLRGSSLGVS